MKTFFLIFICIIMLTGCNDDDSSPAPFEPVTITPILIGKGNDITGLTQISTRITNQTNWNLLLSSMNSVSNTFTETTLDFVNYDVIAIIDSERPCTNFFVNIDAIIENEDNITVQFSRTGDINSCFNSMVQPYHIVKIPKSSKPVVFQ
ncbi:hypothetical protein WFZ85_04105 [Flavobacterium sp. j3]|uniref:Protease complex subunit PrcB family protein n=1 Tax=Flavobacterium aureirubrum TaxID=3133147 RepID=A0ABU9N241_9FLAO